MGPLLKLIDQEPGGFHFDGGSSIGKSTGLLVAGSVWGGGGPKGFIQTWRATSNGLESVAEQANDTFLPLDEMGQTSSDEIGKVTYMLANGQGKIRSTKDLLVRSPMLWRVIFLSTGEISLAEHMRAGGHQVRAGQEVRLIDFPADAGKGWGMFENLHGVPSPDQFATELTSAALAYYGTASIAFLQRLVIDRDRVAEAANGFIEKFLKIHVTPKASGEIFRAARRFALVAVAGEYASDLGITGWAEGDATNAAVTCFRAWLDRRGSLAAGDTDAASAQVRHFLTMYGASRFETICTDDASIVEKNFVRDRVGFREQRPDANDTSVSNAGSEGASDQPTEDGVYVYYVLSEAFKREICKGFNADIVAKALRDAGHLETEKGRLTYQKRLPGMGRQRVYCILPSIFTDGQDGGSVGSAAPWPVGRGIR